MIVDRRGESAYSPALLGIDSHCGQTRRSAPTAWTIVVFDVSIGKPEAGIREPSTRPPKRSAAAPAASTRPPDVSARLLDETSGRTEASAARSKASTPLSIASAC